MNQFTPTLICLSIAIGSSAMATEILPFESATLPIKERLGVVRSEALTLRKALTAAERTEAEHAEMAKRLATLEREEKDISEELAREAKRFRSPFVTYAVPASEPK